MYIFLEHTRYNYKNNLKMENLFQSKLNLILSSDCNL